MEKSLLSEKVQRLSQRDGYRVPLITEMLQEKLLQEINHRSENRNALSLRTPDFDHFKLFDDNYGQPG